MRNLASIAVLFALILTSAPIALAAQKPLSRAETLAIVHALDTVLLNNYVFPDKAKVIVSFLNAKAEQGGYDPVASRQELARVLTDDLIKVSGDLHFSVGLDRTWVASFRQKDVPGNAAVARQRAYDDGAQTNFGFDAAGRLPGNIGYLHLSYFAAPTVAYDTAAAAMRMVENSTAVIIDLRHNNGGHLEMAQLIASYFFPSEKDQLLFDYYYYDNGKRIERGQWVLPGLPGKRMVDKPVYILTSSTSFSSAEWFTYMMKKLGRAKIIGARTSGGAHPVDRKPIDDDFYLQVPIGQIRDPVDHGDFESVGVQPDVEVPSIDALEIAKKLALEELATRSDAGKSDLDWLLPSIAAGVAPPAVQAGTLQAAVGKYEGRMIGLDRGRLYVLWRERFRVGLTPIAPDLFDVEGVSEFRYRLVWKAGKVIGLERVNRDGTTHMYKRL